MLDTTQSVSYIDVDFYDISSHFFFYLKCSTFAFAGSYSIWALVRPGDAEAPLKFC
jgi:hypothetical protein